MIQRAISYAWSVRHQFLKYAAVGVSSVMLDALTLYLLVRWVGMAPYLGVVLNKVIVISFNFLLNRQWSFQSCGLAHTQLFRYLLLAGWNYIFSVGFMYVLNELFGFHYQLVLLASTVVMVSWNFLLFKYWVYKDDAKTESDMSVDFLAGEVEEAEKQKANVYNSEL